MFIDTFFSHSIIFRLASNLKLRLILSNVLILILIPIHCQKKPGRSSEGFFWQCFPFSQHSAQSVKIPPLKNPPSPMHRSTKNSPFPAPSTHHPPKTKKIHPFQPPPHTTRQKQRKFTPFPKSKPKPQKRRKRFIRKRSRSAEQIGIIFISNCSSRQVWLSPPTTDKIKVKNPTKPANCPKNRS